MSWQSHDLNHDQTKHLTENFISQNLFDSLGFNMGIIFFTSDLMEAARDQQHSSDAENGMK
jgi:hypothetical protein